MTSSQFRRIWTRQTGQISCGLPCLVQSLPDCSLQLALPLAGPALEGSEMLRQLLRVFDRMRQLNQSTNMGVSEKGTKKENDDKAPNLGVSNFQTNPISIHLGFAPASLCGIEKHLLGLQVSRWLPQVKHEILSVRNVSPFQNANDWGPHGRLGAMTGIAPPLSRRMYLKPWNMIEGPASIRCPAKTSKGFQGLVRQSVSVTITASMEYHELAPYSLYMGMGQNPIVP